MKKEDYYGKYILREGDLRPEEICKQSCEHYGWTMEVLAYFESLGLVFDNREEALMHWKCIKGSMKKSVDPREFDNLVPVWKRGFEACSEYGDDHPNEIWLLDQDRGILIHIPKGSYTARFLTLKELKKLPKEKGL